ncbi:MAG: DNA-binding protein [Alphaproteobacteria bacterium]
MALFFDQEWFDARLLERGLDRQTLAVLLGLTLQEIEAMWKDQREISAREVTVLSGLLGVTPEEIADRGGVSTPVPEKGGAMAGVLARLDALDARMQKLEQDYMGLQALLAAVPGDPR